MKLTFRKTLYISLAAHLMMFGGAFAFTQYGAGLFVPAYDSYTVALVDPGAMGGQRRQTVSKSVERRNSSDEGFYGVRSEDVAERLDVADDMDAASDVSQIDQAAGRIGRVPPEAWRRIQAALERARRYPRLARRRGIEGEVRLRFRISPTGEVEKVEILKGSGHALLDSASVRTVYRAAPLPYVEGWLEVPLSFVLQ
ncbi:MAG TPA: hypothetical protein DCO77_14340 [Nitrospiraceae bacterium]|nr:hypothetical protein [Nitrospiraceae bacterium]